MRRFYLTVFVLLLSLTAFSQSVINPPSLNCIEGNGTEIEVFWSSPTAACGTLTGYTIFYSMDKNGPYIPLFIDDPSITDTTIDVGFEPVYLYIQSQMNCPGGMLIFSDTLIWDLTPPEVTSISVNAANQIEANWLPSASPDIAAYLVYVNGANIPDTVWGTNSSSYIDVVSDPSISSHTYEIAWFRDCVNDGDRRGSKGDPYNSILLENLEQDECNRSFTFSWNRYENYTAGVIGYSIEASINNGGFVSVDTVSENQLVFLYENAINNNLYCFRVGALLPNGLVAYSNTVCDSAQVVDAPRGAHLRNATVIDENTIHVEYFPDTAGTIDDLNFQRSILGTDYQTWPAANISTSTTSPTFDTYEDVGSNPNSMDYYYRFRRLDDCGNEYFAEAVKTIYLETDLGPSTRATFGYDLSAEIVWTPFEITNGTVTQYHVIKYINGDSTLLTSLSGSITSTEDLEALNSTSLDTICYQIIAETDLEIDGFVSTNTVSQSNIACIQPTPKIISPSAFNPNSVIFMNASFKPIIFFGTEEAYIFRMYNRWGESIFETTNPAIGWDGLIDGNEAPLDAYVYYVSFLGQDGNTYSKSGTVALIRQ